MKRQYLKKDSVTHGIYYFSFAITLNMLFYVKKIIEILMLERNCRIHIIGVS